MIRVAELLDRGLFWLRARFARGAARTRMAAALLALGVLLSGLVGLLWPMLRDFSTYGFHDWDAHAAYRHITTLSLRRYHEGPWWHPWLCGGVPAWGYVEGAPNLVSPYLPIYLLCDIRTALRLEVVGNAIIGLVGAYALARRFCASQVLAAFFAALFVLNGRWAFQAAAGHTWHLQYAVTPWVFYAFERALDAPSRALRFGLLAGSLLAYLCYAGGIYPLPHTALFLTAYAGLRSFFERSVRPLWVLGVVSVAAFGLAAPKLFAVFDYMRGAPRLIESHERIGLGDLWAMLTSVGQAFGRRPVSVPAYNWHEWGLYVGTFGLLAVVAGLLFARGVHGQSFKICGALCLLLGLGDFHENAPWRWLHRVPPFASQHVPSRFHYLMLFFLGLACVTLLARYLDQLLARKPWVDLLLIVPLALYVNDLVEQNQVAVSQSFWMRAPDRIHAAEQFEHRLDAPVSYIEPDWAAPMLLAMFANTGVIRCYGADPALTIGAVAADAPDYRGRAFIADGRGSAEIVNWTPNRARVRVRDASPGALVVYNMNYDPSWSADGRPAREFAGKVAATLATGRDTVEFTYFPRTLKYSLALLAITLIGAAWSVRARARWE